MFQLEFFQVEQETLFNEVDSLFNAHYLLTKEEKKRKKYLLNKLSQNELQ